MIELLLNLKFGEIAVIVLACIIINVLFDFLVKRLTERKYTVTGSREESLYLLNRLSRYGGMLLMLFTIFITTIITMPYAEEYAGEYGFYVVLLLAFIIMIVLQLTKQRIFFDLGQRLRGTTTTRGEESRRLLIVFTVTIAIFMIFIFISNTLTQGMGESGLSGRFLKWLIIGLIYIFLSIGLSPFNKKILKAKPLEEGELRSRLQEFLFRAKVGKSNLYYWPMKKNKHANALVSGILKKEIFLSDYLIEKFTEDETVSVVAHEIGHIKRKHIVLRMLISFAGFLLIPFLLELIDSYEFTTPDLYFFMIIMTFAGAALLYMGFFRFFIIKKQEREADSYVLELGINPRDYIAALYKLARLNHTVMKLGKFDEKFQTHPSIAKRIGWVMDRGGVSEEEFDEIKKRADGDIEQ